MFKIVVISDVPPMSAPSAADQRQGPIRFDPGTKTDHQRGVVTSANAAGFVHAVPLGPVLLSQT